MSGPSTLLARVEDDSLDASAPTWQRWVDGWLVRFCPNKARRARSINAVAPRTLPLAEKIASRRSCAAQPGCRCIPASRRSRERHRSTTGWPRAVGPSSIRPWCSSAIRARPSAVPTPTHRPTAWRCATPTPPSSPKSSVAGAARPKKRSRRTPSDCDFPPCHTVKPSFGMDDHRSPTDRRPAKPRLPGSPTSLPRRPSAGGRSQRYCVSARYPKQLWPAPRPPNCRRVPTTTPHRPPTAGSASRRSTAITTRRRRKARARKLLGRLSRSDGTERGG